MNTYKTLPLAFERGEGVWVFDKNGQKYLDALSGIAVCGLGHAHPAVTAAIVKQAGLILHNSNLYEIPSQLALAELLSKATGLKQSFFCNSGAEANETAFKLMRLFGHKKGISEPKIVVMDNAFHGRTLATLSASGNKKYQQGFEPLMPGFVRVPYNDIASLEKLADTDKNIVAVFVEPIQGEAGIIVPAVDYLPRLRALCDRNQWLLVLDEIQTGMGRTGNLFAFQGAKIMPDMFTTAKGLANGIPIGACVIGEQLMDLFKPGLHGSTFGGNHLSCAAGLATLKEITDQKLWENAGRMGQRLKEGLERQLCKHPQIKEIRGRGLMLGIELDRPCRDILMIALKKGILFNVTNDTVLRLLPPLIIQEAEIDLIIKTLPELIDEFYATV